MLRRTIILFLTTVLAVQAWGSQIIDSLMRELDQAIDNKPLYEARKRGRILPLYNQVGLAPSHEGKFEITKQLFEEYRTFSMDTTLMLAREGKRLALAIGNKRDIWEASLMEAEALKGLGRYYLALDVLDQLPPEALDTLGAQLLYRRSSVYYSLSEVPMPQSDIIAYRDTLARLRTLLMETIDTDEGKAINRLEFLKERGDFQGAIDYYKTLPPDIRALADTASVFNFIIGEAYLKTGARDTALEYLLHAAITDIRNSDRKYNALPLVAKILYDQGDLQHAYDYIICSLSDIRAAHAQSRMYRINDALPIITNAYKDYQKQNEETRHTAWIFALAFILALILGIIAIIVKNKKLKNDGRLLKEKNQELETLKEKSDALNRKLEDTSHTMEEYIGELFNLNSEYINIMQREHNQLIKTARTGKITDLEKAIAALDSPERLATFFAKFDKCFLDIFPHFIEHFNTLLKPEYRYSLPPGQLNPELRIYALMRLGITETSRIASFLHYTNQTVYNYRNRVKSHAIRADIDVYDTLKEL